MSTPFRDILITGGAGFIGSSLALMFRETFPDARVVALDNLTRRGSEFNVPRLNAAGVTFLQRDIRLRDELKALPPFDLLIDCAAEPSARAGLSGDASHVLDTNLTGTLNCLELARQRAAAFLFLSTSRVYPIGGLNSLPYIEQATRFEWPAGAEGPGFSTAGIADGFPLDGPRSLYGATKLAAELVIAEYVHAYGMKCVINRCGVIAGPGQFGREDQGVITLWIARHHYDKPLCYLGFGGEGKQVRDVLHIRDLHELVKLQMASAASWHGDVYDVGGGVERSVSLRELTKRCEKLTGNRLDITGKTETSPVDVRIFITDSRRAEQTFGWRPRLGVDEILAETHSWIRQNTDQLRPILT